MVVVEKIVVKFIVSHDAAIRFCKDFADAGQRAEICAIPGDTENYEVFVSIERDVDRAIDVIKKYE